MLTALITHALGRNGPQPTYLAHFIPEHIVLVGRDESDKEIRHGRHVQMFQRLVHKILLPTQVLQHLQRQETL